MLKFPSATFCVVIVMLKKLRKSVVMDSHPTVLLPPIKVMNVDAKIVGRLMLNMSIIAD